MNEILVEGKCYKQIDPATGKEKSLGKYLGLVNHFSEYGHRFSKQTILIDDVWDESKKHTIRWLSRYGFEEVAEEENVVKKRKRRHHTK